MWWSVWWVWIVAGFLLGMLEIVLPGYIFLGFAIGAVASGILVGIGVAPASPALLVLIFAVCSLVAWLVLRRTMGVRAGQVNTMGVRAGQVKVWDRDINDN